MHQNNIPDTEKMTFEDACFENLSFKGRGGFMGGIWARVVFPNGYGASIIRGEHTHGGDEGLYELAVMKDSPEGMFITYDTLLTDDVIGYLTENQVTTILRKIATFPKTE